MKGIVDFINESISNNSIRYWKTELGFDPTKVDYSKNKQATEIVKTFEEAGKLSELFDYLVSGITEPMREKDWINYVASTDIEDYEIYNGPLK
jgi:hypothetical protein